MKWFRWSYIIVPVIVIATSLIGGMFTNQGLAGWYDTINKPGWTPPGSVIGIVWTVLYTMIAVSAILVWNRPQRSNLFWVVVMLFLINAVLNAGWNYVFFALHSPSWAFVEILVLEATIIALVAMTWSLSRVASVLLMPYAAWVGFASYLTYTIWQLNK